MLKKITHKYTFSFFNKNQLRGQSHEKSVGVEDTDSDDRIEELKLSLSNESSSGNETALLNGNNKNNSSPDKPANSAPNVEQETSAVANNPVQKSPSTTTAHSRQSSQASTTSTSEIKVTTLFMCS